MTRALLALGAALGWAILVGVQLLGPAETEVYPSRPITLVVHSKPGSGVDLMGRKVSEIARAYTDQPLVVENRTGSQGIVAMQHVLAAEPDGYTVLAVTGSFLSTVLVNQGRVDLEDFVFVGRLMDDPEALIVHRQAEVHDLASLLEDAHRNEAGQVWIGPGTGGRDHLMALRSWEVLGVQGRWLDYKTGPLSVLAMLRQEAPVYVGNPGDIIGKPDLAVAAMAAPRRLEGLPEVPTFREEGFDLVESMWRGFAVRKEVPPERIATLAALLESVATDEAWASYCASRHVFPDWAGPEDFTAQVRQQTGETTELLERAGLMASYQRERALPSWLVALLLVVGVGGVGLVVPRLRKDTGRTELILGASALAVAALFGREALGFVLPEGVEDVTHPAVVPGIWLLLLAGLGVGLVVSSLRAGGVNPPATKGGASSQRMTWVVVGASIAFAGLVPVLGYLLAVGPFLWGLTWLLGTRDWRVATAFAGLFAVASHLLFHAVLGIELPAGML